MLKVGFMSGTGQRLVQVMRPSEVFSHRSKETGILHNYAQLLCVSGKLCFKKITAMLNGKIKSTGNSVKGMCHTKLGKHATPKQG